MKAARKQRFLPARPSDPARAQGTRPCLAVFEGLGVQGLGVKGFGFKGLGFKVQGSGFRVSGFVAVRVL